MDATEATRGEHVDAGRARQKRGGGDRGAGVLLGDSGVGEVADRGLGHVVVVGE